MIFGSKAQNLHNLKIKAIADKIILINVSNQGMNKWVWLTLGCLGLYSLIITLKFINLRKNFKISNEIANKSLDILAITGEELYSTIKAAEKINNINKELNINIKKSIKDMKDIGVTGVSKYAKATNYIKEIHKNSFT